MATYVFQLFNVGATAMP